MSRRTIILLAIGLVPAGLVAATFLIHREVQSRIGPRYVYELSEQPKHLTEELALAKASETLSQGGLDVKAWRPVPAGRTATSAGRKDEFVSRNAMNPNRVVIMFTNGGTSSRFVSVELEGGRVICQTSVGK
jgi:hypothetical protein